MNAPKQIIPLKPFAFGLVLALLLASCSLPGDAPDASPTPEVIVQDTPTASPEPGLVILLAPDGADANLTAEVEAAASSYAVENGFTFERRSAMEAGNIDQLAEVIVVLPPDPGLEVLAAAASQPRFVAIDIQATNPLDNIVTLMTSSAGNAEAAFIAGYTAAAVTDDWRVGVVHSAETRDLADAFIQGAEFFCGSCVPVAPPYLEYPQRSEAASPADWKAAVDPLLSESVRTFYIVPEMQSPELEQYLTSWGVLMIGSATPGEAAGANWVATIGTQQTGTFADQLRAALAGTSLNPGQPALAFSDVNRAYLSEARQAHIEEVIADLLAGFIVLSTDG